jgi:hypothetical protein
MVVPILHGITANEAQPAIFDSLLDRPYTTEQHSRECCIRCNVDPPTKDEVVDNEDLFVFPKCEKKIFVEVTQ